MPIPGLTLSAGGTKALLETWGQPSCVASGSRAETLSRGQIPPMSLILFIKEKAPKLQHPLGRQ